MTIWRFEQARKRVLARAAQDQVDTSDHDHRPERRPVSREPKTVRLDLAPTTVSPRQARAAIQQLLDDASEAFVAQAMLLTSEVVTNAVLYTSSEFTLSAEFDPTTGLLRVEVADRSPDIPQAPAAVEPQSIGGRGLRIVADVARRWGVKPTQHGKVVWFELTD
jgi:anti-sigma regulatory factor (Ser/Thr protein kinase)